MYKLKILAKCYHWEIKISVEMKYEHLFEQISYKNNILYFTL